MLAWLKTIKLPPLTPETMRRGYSFLSAAFAALLLADYFLSHAIWSTAFHAFMLGTTLVGMANASLLKTMNQQMKVMNEQQRIVEVQNETIKDLQILLHQMYHGEAPTEERRLN